MLNYLSNKQERERELKEQLDFIAYEIHDGACQYMTAAQMMFGVFRQEQSNIEPEDWSSFDMGREFINHASEELQRLVRGLRPIQLAAGSLPAAVECLIRDIHKAGGPEIELCEDIQSDHIPLRLEMAVFRIVQESLTNACRHSQSEKILVGLTQDNESLCIQVQDWGIGFDSQNIQSGHYGLEGIRRRVERLHGSLTITSNAGEGTLINVELPFKE